MHTTIAVGLFALVAGVASQSSQPPCVASCIQTDPVSSQCNGDETGAALAQCTCDSLRGSLLIQCIKRCSVDDQSAYAKGLPASCAAVLFPGQVSGNGSATGTGTATASSNSAQTSAGATQTTSQTAGTTTQPASSSTSNAAVQTMVPNILAGGIAAAMIFL